jgi:hypothetical protein
LFPMKRLMACRGASREWNTAPFRAASGQLGEVALPPSTASEIGVKWKVQWGWRASPLADVQMNVGGVVVEDHAHHLLGRDRTLDGVPDLNVRGVAACRQMTTGAVEHAERRDTTRRR